MSDRPTCATCPFWRRPLEHTYGECRRFPPQSVTAGRRGDNSPLGYTDFDSPRVMAEDWCGEHPDFPAWLAARRSDGDPA